MLKTKAQFLHLIWNSYSGQITPINEILQKYIALTLNGNAMDRAEGILIRRNESVGYIIFGPDSSLPLQKNF